jgi:Barstar (barnase inhibitor)
VWQQAVDYVRDSAPVQTALGVAYGTLQALAPGGFIVPSPWSSSQAFEAGRGIGQVATGITQVVTGAGMMGGGGRGRGRGWRCGLQFPRYFGSNWNAFVDCMGDLDWLRASGFLLVLLDAPEVLRDGDPDEFGLLLERLENSAEAFAVSTEFRAALPFHVLLHATPERASELERRLAATGRDVPMVEL